jgi:hypothetical protein
MKLNEVIPWGRSVEEYGRMFALSGEDLAGNILGCGDGPASFNAVATALGRRVVSCDPIYAFSAGEIERLVEEDLAGNILGCGDEFQRADESAGSRMMRVSWGEGAGRPR